MYLSVSISTGGRRISNDPFTLCQDLQVLETRRKSDAFLQRRQSEQYGLPNSRRKSSAFLPSSNPLLERTIHDKRTSKSVEKV